MSPRFLSMSFYNRPEYARQTLAALQRCEGVENCTLVACVDPGNEEIRAMVEGVDFVECRRRFNPTRLGANRNILQCFEEGLRLSEYVVYLEEDTLLAPDALRFFCVKTPRSPSPPPNWSPHRVPLLFFQQCRCDAQKAALSASADFTNRCSAQPNPDVGCHCWLVQQCRCDDPKAAISSSVDFTNGRTDDCKAATRLGWIPVRNSGGLRCAPPPAIHITP